MGDLNLVKIDGKPIAELGTALLNKLEKCLGWIASPKGTTSCAIDYYIKRIESDKNLPPYVGAALISNAKNIIREYSNQNNILNIALNQFDGTEKSDQLDEDWLSHFFDEAKHVSNEDVQLIWAKILSNECKNPGSTPKKLIHILSLMSTESAKHFSILCKFVMKSGKIYLPIIDRKNDFFKKNGLSYYNLLDLTDLGLINFSATDNVINRGILKLTYFDSVIFIKSLKRCPIGNVVLTTAGTCLFQSILPAKAQDEYLNVCTAYWKRKGCTIKIANKP